MGGREREICIEICREMHIERYIEERELGGREMDKYMYREKSRSRGGRERRRERRFRIIANEPISTASDSPDHVDDLPPKAKPIGETPVSTHSNDAVMNTSC